MKKASAKANANIALIKYWGKRDQRKMLPHNSSLSLTGDTLCTHTTVEFNPRRTQDVFVLNRREYAEGTPEYEIYIQGFMKKIRSLTGCGDKVRVESINYFPTAAGLASSASGFAALTGAINEALGMGWTSKEMSRIARLGSGSASRSVFGGFAVWYRGREENGEDSFAEELYGSDYWPEFRMVVAVNSRFIKKFKSRFAMQRTVETSPMYRAWLETAEKDFEAAKKALAEKDFSALGQIVESNALKMHATMITTRPAVIYWNQGTVQVLREVEALRQQGLECYYTMDAGPQVKVLCLESQMKRIMEALQKLPFIEDLIVVKPGKGMSLTEQDLF